MKALCVLLALVACAAIKETGGDIGGPVAEVTLCKLPGIDCGHVYMCDEPADNPLGHVEICIEDGADISEAEGVYGACEPTPRHQGLCLWCCGADCGRGANAYNGAWCP